MNIKSIIGSAKKCGHRNDVENSDCSYCQYSIDPDLERDRINGKNFKIMSTTFIILMILAIGIYFAIN